MDLVLDLEPELPKVSEKRRGSLFQELAGNISVDKESPKVREPPTRHIAMPQPGRDDHALSKSSRNQLPQMNVLAIHEAMTDDELDKIDKYVADDPDYSREQLSPEIKTQKNETLL